MKDVPGGLTGGATPVPIPNTEVKPSKADDTAAVRQWESRTLPGYNKGPMVERSAGLFYFTERKRGSLVIPCARATRGRRLPSLDARTTGINQATLAGKLKKKRPAQNFRCGPLDLQDSVGKSEVRIPLEAALERNGAEMGFVRIMAELTERAAHSTFFIVLGR